MKKFVVFMLLALLSIISVSQVVADYELPGDVIDIPSPSAGIDPCLTDAGSGVVGFTPCDPCSIDAGSGHVGFDPCDPCVALGADTPHITFDPCDPCESIDLDSSFILPGMISLEYSEIETSDLDAFMGDFEDDCDEDDETTDKGPDESDIDADGILDEDDNCPTDYNPVQENTWGTGAGDACEKPYRSDNGLVFGFFGSEGVGLYGFCTEEGCQFIANAFVADFAEIMSSGDYEDSGNYSPELEGGKVLNIEEGNPSSMTVLYVVGTDEAGNPIYQINVYLLQQKLGENGETEIFPMLVDDDINITVEPDGSWTWVDKHPN